MQGPFLNPNSGKVGNFDVYLETIQGMYKLSVGQKSSYSMVVYFSSDFFHFQPVTSRFWTRQKGNYVIGVKDIWYTFLPSFDQISF